LAIDAIAGLARVATLQKEYDQAAEFALEVLNWMENNGTEGVGDPLLAYKGAYQALLAAGNIERGKFALEEAYALLVQFANSIKDDKDRQNYFHNIEPNKSIWEDFHQIKSKQTVVYLPALDASQARSLRDDELVEVTWTVRNFGDDKIVKKAARRQTQILRLLDEARIQGGAPTINHIAKVLDVDRSTIKRDLAHLRKAGHVIHTRGSKEK
jgi:hypothetical protein